MSVCVPNILILGHSFVRRLRDDLAVRFDARAAPNFHLPESQSRSQSMPVRGLVVGKALAKRNFPVRFCTVHACSLMILIKSLSTFIAGLQSMFHDHRDLCKIHVPRKYIYLIVFRWNDLSVSLKDNM